MIDHGAVVDPDHRSEGLPIGRRHRGGSAPPAPHRAIDTKKGVPEGDEKGKGMIRQRLATGVVALSLLALGCARQPMTTAASSPPPTGAAVSSGARSGGPIQAAARQGGGPSAARPAESTSAATSRPSPAEFVAVGDVQDIHFDFDQYTIRPEDTQILDRNASWLKANARDLLLIEGHCDERGTNEYNVALGDRRAKTTMDYLVAHGVPAARITIVSYGEERPLCTTHDEACWAKNRRAHFLVKRG